MSYFPAKTFAHIAAVIICIIDTITGKNPSGGVRASYQLILDNHAYSYTGAWRHHAGFEAWRASDEYASTRRARAARPHRPR
jgi:hypothetical protein